MAAGWECPKCFLVMAPAVLEHRCDPGGEVTAKPAVAPYEPPWTETIPSPNTTYPWPVTTTSTPGITYSFGVGTGNAGADTTAAMVTRIRNSFARLAVTPST